MQRFLLQVCEWKEPQDLAQLLDLELRETGEPQHRVLQRVKDVAKYSVKTSEAALRKSCVCADCSHTLTTALVFCFRSPTFL